jgi:Cu/Ag efflux pump CusA
LLMPGVGSVIYRGLAAVIVGGMLVSTIFTVLLLPCFLRMGEKRIAAVDDDEGEPNTLDSPSSELKSAA